MRQQCTPTLLLVPLLIVLGLALFAATKQSPMNPFEGERVYVNPSSQSCEAMRSMQDADPETAELLQTICVAPKAVWLGEWTPNVGTYVAATIESAQTRAELPLFVAYYIPERDVTGRFSEGGAENNEAYLTWIREVANAIGEAKAVVVIEPDALAGLDLLNTEAREERVRLLRQAVGILKDNPNTFVYVDAGHAFWKSPDTMAERLREVGMDQADGFALNVSNFVSTNANLEYGERISRALGGAHFIIDSSRNGLGPAHSLVWCNPPGRALGERGYVPEHPRVDWVGWIKAPGESDGECNGGPVAGEFWLEYALELVRNAREQNTLN